MQPFALRTPALEPPRDPVPQSGRSVKRSRVETPEKVRGEQDPETRSHIHVLSSTLIPKRSIRGGEVVHAAGLKLGPAEVFDD